MPFDLADGVVIGAVFIAQVFILRRCLDLVRRDESEVLTGLQSTFEADIASRAKRGEGPDWVRYRDEEDRIHERWVDRMRVLATAALVVGIGGTMSTLALELWRQQGQVDMQNFVLPLGVSLLGVANHLVITLFLLPVADSRFEANLSDFREALSACSSRHAPPTRFADAVRDQLGGAFREAVAQFPEAFAQLDRSVQNMSVAAAEQSASILEAASGLQRGVDGLTAAAAQIAPAGELIRAATAELRALPDQLRQTFEEAREAWASRMCDDREAFLGEVRQVLDDQKNRLDPFHQALQEWESQRSDVVEQQHARWLESVDRAQNASVQFLAAAKGLPAAFGREVEESAVRLGKAFNLGAAQHAGLLAREMREGVDQLKQTFKEAREAWADRMCDDRKAFQGEVRQVLDDQHARLDSLQGALQGWERERGEAVEQLRVASKEFVDTAKGLPAMFAREVDQIAERLGKELGREFTIGAQQHIGDLVREMRDWALPDQIRESMREMQNHLLNNTHEVVGKSAEEVHRRVGEPLMSELQKVTSGIGEAVSILPERASTFAASLSAADEKLKRSIERLEESAEHLKRVADTGENFQIALTRALQDGAAEGLASIRRDLQEGAADFSKNFQAALTRALKDGMAESLAPIRSDLREVADRIIENSQSRGFTRRIARLFKRGDE